MSSAILTIIGFYNYDPTLFDDMIMPEGIDKNLVIDSIIMRGGEYEVLYPNPALLKSLIGSWSRQWYNVFYNWLRANDEIDTVNPLYNYDRIEDWSDSSANHSISNDTMSGTGSTTGEDSTSGSNSTNSSGSVTDTHKISAEDSNDFVNKTQDLQSSSSSTSANTSSTANTSTSSTTNTQSEAVTDGTVNSSHTGRIRGNIGVTTSAQMFAEWVQVLRDNGNIYDSIAFVFCNNFVIPIL